MQFGFNVTASVSGENVESNTVNFTPPETATITMSDANFDWDGGSSYSLPYQATVRVYNRPLGNTVTATLSMYNQTFGNNVETKTVNGQGGTYTFNISREFIEMNWPTTMTGDTFTLDLTVKDTTNNVTLNQETAILTIAEL